MGAADLVDATIAGEHRDHLNAHFLKVLADDPALASHIEIAEQVDRVRLHRGRVARADEREQGAAGSAVAVALGAAKALGQHWNHRDSDVRLHPLAHRRHIVADHAHDAGSVDKGGARHVLGDEPTQGRFQTLLAAEHHFALAHVSRTTNAMKLWPRGQGATNVPGVGRAPHGTVHQMKRVRDGIEHDARAAEGARPLADRSGRARLVAVECDDCITTISHHLGTAFLQQIEAHGARSGR